MPTLKSKPATPAVTVPEHITTVFNAYGHAFKLEQAVATRAAPSRGWYAVLFQVDGILEAVSFQRNYDGEWEVDDDCIGPFESVKEFKTKSLVDKWF